MSTQPLNGPAVRLAPLPETTRAEAPLKRASRGASEDERRPLIEYIAPITVFGLFTICEHYVPAALYPVAYSTKICAVTLSQLMCRIPLQDLHPTRKALSASILIGVAVFIAWIGIDTIVPYPHLGARSAYDPFGLPILGTVAFLAVRLFGLIVVVPVVEELFYRSFLLRYLTKADFLSLPIGTFSLTALGAMVVISGIAHPEWLVAVVASGIYAWWLRHSRSLFATIVAHATTNALLGVYILVTYEWTYW